MTDRISAYTEDEIAEQAKEIESALMEGQDAHNDAVAAGAERVEVSLRCLYWLSIGAGIGYGVPVRELKWVGESDNGSLN